MKGPLKRAGFFYAPGFFSFFRGKKRRFCGVFLFFSHSLRFNFTFQAKGMDRMEFFKEQYYKELEYRHQLDASLALPIGLITALIATGFYLVTHFDYSCRLWLIIVFGLAMVVFVFMLVVATINLIQSCCLYRYGYDYAALPIADEADSYFKMLQEDEEEMIIWNATAEERFENYLLSGIIRATGINQRENKRKECYKQEGLASLIDALIILSLAALIFLGNHSGNIRKALNEVRPVDNYEQVRLSECLSMYNFV